MFVIRPHTLCINGCQFKVKIHLNYQLKNEVGWANFNTYKRIFNWQPSMHRVYWTDHHPRLIYQNCSMAPILSALQSLLGS